MGAKEPLFGASPEAKVKIRKAARRIEKVPEGYALDEGRSTTDPEAELRG
jgi:LDH2 family malate/lactate/ureidoglycolate dehydrogenase